MEALSEEAEHASLLNHLKTIVETLLGCCPGQSWNIHGGSQRLNVAMVEILGHGFKFLLENGKPDLWVFIQGLSWLQPTLAASPSFLNHLRSPVRNSDKAMIWLRNSIDSGNLSEKMSCLLSDYDHVISCYSASAFLCQRPYSEAVLMCLRALEQRQISLLARIDPALYSNRKITTKKHRRCSSYPEPKTLNAKTWSVKNVIAQPIGEKDSKRVEPMKGIVGDAIMEARIDRFHDRVVNSLFKSTPNEKKMKEYIKKHLLKRWFSSEDVHLLRRGSLKYKRLMARKSRFAETSVPDCPERNRISNLLAVSYDTLKREPTRNAELDTQPSCETTTSLSIDSQRSGTASNQSIRDGERDKERRRSIFFKLPFRIWEGEESEEDSDHSSDSRALIRANSKKSFIENVGNIALPMSVSAFPKPSRGQSIMSFLTSGALSRMNSAELDRENAHFNIAEAMIATLEQVNFNQRMAKLRQDETTENSDEEMHNLKTQLRIRRRQRRNERSSALDATLHSDSTDCTNTVTTDQSVNSLSSSVYSTSESFSTDQDEDEVTAAKKNLVSTAKSGLSVHKRSVVSENMHDSVPKTDTSVSAESVAISLLRKFTKNQLPAASEIEWLVSERDAPQQILPLPNCLQIDDAFEHVDASMLRGTTEWAPPRPQIIFTPHPSPSRKVLLEKQQYKCAGCGTEVARKYASKLRYCDYLGRYFCAGCHSEQTAVIPGRVLTKWDFTKHPVSNFSYQLLDQMWTDPLFNVTDHSSALYSRVRSLQKIRLLRVALFYLKDFIFSCKYSDDGLHEKIKGEPQYIYAQPDYYSMADFVRAKDGQLLKTLTEIEKSCERHVNQCQLCRARGFLCEICDKQEIIYPWELNRVVRCNQCGSCHHIKCYQREMACPKCRRISQRNDCSEKNSASMSGS